MRHPSARLMSLGLLLRLIPLLLLAQSVHPQAQDPRLREAIYDPAVVISVPVRRGIVTLIQLGADEAIADVGSGLGGDCSKPEMSWCIAAQPGGRVLFVKPKSGASAPNNLAVVTDKRAHSFRLVVLADKDARQPVYRLQVTPSSPAAGPARTGSSAQAPLSIPQLLMPAPLPALPDPPDFLAERLKARPLVRNAQYSLAQGKDSEDIVPTLIFDDGRFTYLRFPGNREVPAVFHVLDDGSESLVNMRMEDELLVVDRVSRQLMLRAGSAVVGIWNEAFDLDGKPPEGGTTVPGVRRVLKAARLTAPSGAPSDRQTQRSGDAP